MLAPDDVRKHLHIRREDAYKLFRTRSFPAIKINNRWRVSETAYLDWLHRREFEHAPYMK